MNGMIELSDAEMDELALLESVFNSNMSACCLKLNEHKKAYDYARLALNLDAKNSKAVYRKAQAQFGMSDFDGARQTCENALKKQESADFRKLLSEIVAKNEQQLAKQRQCEKEMAQRMSEKLKVSA
jgi:Tfp pilus assembly protein PilF